jgi:hypothetical protein
VQKKNVLAIGAVVLAQHILGHMATARINPTHLHICQVVMSATVLHNHWWSKRH